MFITNNHESFHLWWKKNLVEHEKVSKYYDQDCRKLIFERFLLKLATESTYIFQSQFYKQTDGCAMGGPLSVTFSKIYLTKLEKDQIKPRKPKFYRRFVDDVISK